MHTSTNEDKVYGFEILPKKEKRKKTGTYQLRLCAAVLIQRLIIQYRGFSDKFYDLFSLSGMDRGPLILLPTNAGREREKSLHVATNVMHRLHVH
jgi:hypothetical protein